MSVLTVTRVRFRTPVRVRRHSGDGVVAQPLHQPCQPVHRATGPSRAVGAASARHRERMPDGAIGVGVPRVCPADEVRRVERQGTHPFRVPDGERLAEERPVGVAVQVDLADAELVEHGREVVGREGAAVQVRGGAEVGSAGSDRTVAVALVGLQPRAADRVGLPGSPVVDEQELAAAQQGPEEVEVVAATVGRRISRSALGGHDRAQGRPGTVGGQVQLVGDADLRRSGTSGRVEPSHDLATSGGSVSAGVTRRRGDRVDQRDRACGSQVLRGRSW